MARYFVSGTSAAALANGSAIAAVVPAAAVACKIVRATFGVVNAGGTISDFQVGVGINRATARGTATTTAAGVKADPDTGASVITGVDQAWTVQPTLAAADAVTIGFNVRGGADMPFPLVNYDGLMTAESPAPECALPKKPAKISLILSE